MNLLFFSSCRLLDRVPSGPPFIALCFVVRSIDALGFAAAMTSTFAMTAKIFPNNVATVLVSADGSCVRQACCLAIRIRGRQEKHYSSCCFPPFLPAPWKIINNLWFTVRGNDLILLLLCTVNTNAYFILLLFSLFRVVWRFSQDSGSSWGLQLEGGSISLSDMKSLFCFSDVSCWLWFLSTYTSCQPSVIVCDFSILILSFWVISKYLDFERLLVLLSTQSPIPRRIRSFDFSPKWKSSSSATPYSLLARDWASWMPRCPCLLWRRYIFLFFKLSRNKNVEIKWRCN